MSEFKLEPRDIIKKLSPYIPGTPAEIIKKKYDLSEVYKLASNENLQGLPQELIQRICRELKEINYYPDGDNTFLKEKISENLNISKDQIIFGAGSDEILLYIALVYLEKGDNIIQSWPAFVRYLQNSLIMEADIKKISLKNWKHDFDSILNAIDDKTKIIFIDNPINPVGTYSDSKEIEKFLKKVPSNILIVMDQAYFEFVKEKDYPDALSYLNEYQNVIVLRTFSKAFALAGFRIGYGVANAEIIDYLNRVRCPFNVNRAAQTAALFSFDYIDYFNKNIDTIIKNRIDFEMELKKHKINYVPSVTNFVLVDTKSDSLEVYKSLCKKGIIVRPMKGLESIDTYVRITISPDENINKKVIEELKKIEILDTD